MLPRWRTLTAALIALSFYACDDGDSPSGDGPNDQPDTTADAGGEDTPDTGDETPDAARDGIDAETADDAGGPPPFDPTPRLTCPGSPGCDGAAEGGLRAGASAQQISDIPFELPILEYLVNSGYCNEAFGDNATRCGELDRDFLRNCGTDRLCERDDGYPGPDEDGTEGDVDGNGRPIYEYFRDCGLDNLCEGEDGYPGPDEGEGNNAFDGLWLAGFQFNRPALGVRDPLWARTVALERGDTTITITSIDAVGVFFDDVVRIRERARELLAERSPDLDIDYIFVSATHSHETPDTAGQWAGEVDPEIDIPLETGVNPRYIAHLHERAALSVVEAVESLQLANMKVARTHTGVDGLIRDSRDPIVINDEMGVIHLTDMAGGTIATLVNWGNHPEALADINNYISSDFAHGLRAGIDDGIPETPATAARDGLGGVTIYLQGTVGGLMTPLGVRVDDLQGEPVQMYSFARTDTIGYRLAEHALDALDGAGEAEVEDIDDPMLAVAATWFTLPVENRVFHVGLSANIFNRETPGFDADRDIISPEHPPHLATEMAIIRIGPVTMYSVPGELFPELAIGGYDGALAFQFDLLDPDNPNPPNLDNAPDGPYFNDIVPGTYKWILGLGNDEIGYLVPEYDYVLHDTAPYFNEAEGDHYEETNSVGPSAVPLIREVLQHLADELTPM